MTTAIIQSVNNRKRVRSRAERETCSVLATGVDKQPPECFEKP